jgi:hypothetical protein
MKKLFVITLICAITVPASAQFFNGLGITLGVTAANQKFAYKDPSSLVRKNYVFGMNASLMGEFTSYDYVRWVSEIQFNQKGAVDKREEGNYANRLNYLSWNNYLKIRYELYSFIPYVLVGPRLDYTLTQAIGSPDVAPTFLPLHLSLAVGGGAELISYSKWKLFAEAFYVPDVMPAYAAPNVDVMNKDFELRIGLKYNFHENRENCNTPTYVE